MNFKRDDGREIEIDIKWAPAERDVGIMSEYVDEYTLPKDEPDLTEAEEKRFYESVEPPEPDDFDDNVI